MQDLQCADVSYFISCPGNEEYEHVTHTPPRHSTATMIFYSIHICAYIDIHVHKRLFSKLSILVSSSALLIVYRNVPVHNYIVLGVVFLPFLLVHKLVCNTHVFSCIHTYKYTYI